MDARSSTRARRSGRDASSAPCSRDRVVRGRRARRAATARRAAAVRHDAGRGGGDARDRRRDAARPRPVGFERRATSRRSRARSASRCSPPARCTSCSVCPTAGSLDDRAGASSSRVGYVASLGVAVVALRRPAVAAARPRSSSWRRSTRVVALVGFVARGQRAPLSVRARFQWPAWGVTVAVAIGAASAVLNALVDWPQPIGAIAVGATVLVPISLVLGASRRLGVRIDRLLVAHDHAGRARRAGRCVVPAHRARARAVRPTRASARCSVCRCWPPRSPRCSGYRRASGSTEWATRRVYGERHAPDEVLRTFGSRLTRALPLDELLLQLAESLEEDDGARRRRGVDPRRRRRLERAVSVPDRGPAHRSRSAARRRRSSRAPACRVRRGRGCGCRRSCRPESDPILRVAPVTNSGELLGLLVVRRPDGAVPVRRGRRPGVHRARPPGRPRAAQRQARLGAAGVARRGPPPGRRAARAHAPASSRRPTRSGAGSSATCTTARSSTSSRSR